MARKKIQKNPTHGNAKYIRVLIALVIGWVIWQTCVVDGHWSPPNTFGNAENRLRRVVVGATDDVNDDLKDRNRKLRGVANDREKLNDKRVKRDLEQP